MEYFLLLSYSQRVSASLGVVPTVNKKTQINSRTYSFLSKLTYMLINIDQQPNIKPPERLTYMLKIQLTAEYQRLLRGKHLQEFLEILRIVSDCVMDKKCIV